MKTGMKIKINIINEIINNFKKYNSVVIVEYKKITVVEFTELRKILIEKNIFIKVYKNKLVSLAIKKIGLIQLDFFLKGPNVFIFSLNEEFIALKILSKFARINKTIKLKAGIHNGKILDTKKIIEISELPTKEELLLKFVLILKNPIKTFLILLKEISKK